MCSARIERLQTERVHLDAVLRMFRPDFKAENLPVRHRRPTKSPYFRHGELTKRIYDALRIQGTIASLDVAQAAMREKGLGPSAYTLHAEDDDFGQPGTLVRKVWNDAQRDRFVDQVAGSLLGGVHGVVLDRAFQYWKDVDAATGKRIEEKVRAGSTSQPAEGMGER